MLVFQVERGLYGSDDSNFGPKQGGGDSEKTLSKLPNKKSKQKAASFERF